MLLEQEPPGRGIAVVLVDQQGVTRVHIAEPQLAQLAHELLIWLQGSILLRRLLWLRWVARLPASRRRRIAMLMIIPPLILLPLLL